MSLPAPAVKRDNRWFVPLDFLPRALGPVLDLRLDLRRPTRLLVMGDLRVPRIVTRIDSGSANASVTFEITPVTPAKVSAEAGRLVVQFDADALDLLIPTVPQQPFIASIAPGEGNTVVIATGPRYGAYRVVIVAGRRQFVAPDRRPHAQHERPGRRGAAAPTPPVDIRPSVTPTPSTGLRTVVIDPGHGGDELGAQGPRGTLEKEITLAVSRRLRTLIESRLGLRVFLTREDDRTRPARRSLRVRQQPPGRRLPQHPRQRRGAAVHQGRRGLLPERGARRRRGAEARG